MDYRREIDGLRAVAVVPVILFHAGFELFSGGFVGVDVFFVISGYLITTIILSDMERDAFSLMHFYERRARRILPALFLVMLVCLPIAWLWLLPADMIDFSRSLIAVSTFSSNLYFWQSAGYWGIENELKPLLHTWSLAVEEQYYLLFPLILMLVWRFSKRWVVWLFIVLAAASLVLAQWGAFRYPTATFFLLVTRGWELAIGAGIAAYLLYRKPGRSARLSGRWTRELLGVTGVILIGYAIFAFDESVPFPGVYALIPTVGTALIILFSSQATTVGQLLGLKPIVGLGLISYSAYLWHLPLFAFAKYRSLVTPSVTLLLGLSILSMLLAYFSWRYFEQPFRNKEAFSRKSIFAYAGFASLFFIAFGFSGHYYGGWPDRMDPALQVSVEAAKVRKRSDDLCLTAENRPGSSDAPCVLSSGTNRFAVLLGDSHAIAMSGAIKSAFEQTNIGLIAATERGCPPVLGVYVYTSEADKLRCFNHNESTYRYLENTPNVEYVILVARWALYTEGQQFDNEEGGVEPHEALNFDAVSSNKRDSGSTRNLQREFKQAYIDSIEKLLTMGKKVILVYPIPEVGWNVPRYITSSYLSNAEDVFSLKTGSTSHAVFRKRNAHTYAALDLIGDHSNLARVYPESLFCSSRLESRCIVQSGERLLYGDDDHLSNAGATLVTSEIMRHVEK